MLARAACVIGLPGAELDGPDGGAAGGGEDCGVEAEETGAAGVADVLLGSGAPGGPIALAGSNGPRIRGPDESGGGACSPAAGRACGVVTGWASRCSASAGGWSRRITGIGAVSSSGPTRS